MALVGFALSGIVAIGCGLRIRRARRVERAVQRAAAALEADLAAALARADQAEHRSQLLVSMANRTQVLVDRQIERLVALERDAVDADALDDLVSLDHLAVQARRATEAALAIGGQPNPRRWRRPVALTDVTRAAVAEVDGYRRVQLISSEDGTMIDGAVVADVAHLLAELIDGALLRAGSAEPVTVQRAGATIVVRPGSVPSEIVTLLATRHGITVQEGPSSMLLVVPPSLLAAVDVTDRSEPALEVVPDTDLRGAAGMADAAWPLRAVPAQVIERVKG